MAASMLTSLAAMAAGAASFSSLSNRAYADGPFRFSPLFSFSNPSATPETEASKSESMSEGEVSKGGFDPESLERGAKALREINNSPHARQVFDVMRKQEHTRLTELEVEKANHEAIQVHAYIWNKVQAMPLRILS